MASPSTIAVGALGQRAIREATRHEERYSALRHMGLGDDGARAVLADMVVRSQRSGESVGRIWGREYPPMYRDWIEGTARTADAKFVESVTADSTGILDLIDSAIADATVSGDAMRCGVAPTGGAPPSTWRGASPSLVIMDEVRAHGPTFNEAFLAIGAAIQRFGEQLAQALEASGELGLLLQRPDPAGRFVSGRDIHDYRRRTKHRNRRGR